tara:strand:+ start:2500 stop:2916 length:417 start_codon:yes stop_codon:yes gene_type:complete
LECLFGAIFVALFCQSGVEKRRLRTSFYDLGNHTVNRSDISIFVHVFLLIFCAATSAQTFASEVYIPSKEEIAESDVEIVAGEDKTIYEYRVNGYLLMIKIVPKRGKPYYMVPGDGSPHYEGLDHANKLYPQWVLFEW